jgi:hypothetical protein
MKKLVPVMISAFVITISVWTTMPYYSARAGQHEDANQLLCTVATDAFPEKTTIRILLNENGDANGLLVEGPNETDHFTINQLKTGATIVSVDGRSVVAIIANDLDVKSGGKLIIKYLYNGIPPVEYKGREFEVIRNGQDWSLSTNDKSGRRIFNLMYFQTNTFFGKTIGIEKLSVK